MPVLPYNDLPIEENIIRDVAYGSMKFCQVLLASRVGGIIDLDTSYIKFVPIKLLKLGCYGE